MKNFYLAILFVSLISCDQKNNELVVLDNADSNEITFILELNNKGNSKEDVEEFTQYLSDFIEEREPSTVYGYYISEDGNKVTLIERYNNSQDGIQHGIDFLNGPNFDKFFEIFEIESFLNGEKCFVAGSTWPEDYPLFLNYLIDYTSTKIIIAPHEVNSNTVSKLKTIINKEIAVWSTFNSAQDEDKRILVIDSVGLLAQIYQYAHLAYVGGGMGNKGLHNILEPVVFGVPVFVGKNFQNFKEAQELVQKKGVFSVKNEAEFISIYETLSEEKYNLIQSINRNYINQHSGATKKTLSFLAPHLRL